MRAGLRPCIVAISVVVAVFAGGATATALPRHHSPDHSITGSASDNGSVIELVDAEELKGLEARYWRLASAGPWYDYRSVSPCGGHPDRPGSDELCGRAVTMCSSGVSGDGPAVAIYRREVDEDGAPVAGSAGEWSYVGYTCLPGSVPGNTGLTMAMIRDAFHDTNFSVPTVNIQPEGDVTLVNLPTYFEVRFPEAGFGPDEVDTPDPARLLGYRIEVRPVLKSVTYHLGSQTVGPTTSLGGPHPTGDIRATYAQPGEQRVWVDVVYTGQFRVGGSEWFDIPGEVDLEGAPVTLTVREAKSRLYTG